MIDIHTHVLPKVDDGARDWDTCLDMLAKSYESGVRTVIATPHFIPWRQIGSPEKIQSLCDEAQKKLLEERGISMDIYPGNEIYYNMDSFQNLRDGKILTLAGTRYILVEFEATTSYQVFCRAVKEFQDGGYIPIIAHMERYDCLRRPGKVQELREMGALFQMNTDAFQGSVFDAGSRWSKKCLLDGNGDFIASDMHDKKRRPPMTEDELSWIRKKLKPKYQKELLYKNAQRIFDSIGV